jgi:hypothetical protein
VPLIRVLLLAALAVLCSCHREVRAESRRELQAQSGVPITLAPGSQNESLTWQIGEDGSPAGKGATFTHAFDRTGAYEVRALDGAEVAATFKVAVAPRPVLEAIPPEAKSAVYVPKLADLPKLARFFDRAIGSVISDNLYDREPLLRYAMSSLNEGAFAELGLDAQEGAAAFQLEDGSKQAAIGIEDAARALDGARKLFAEHGFNVEASDDAFLVMHRDSERMIAFIDRGYLYISAGDTRDGDAVERAKALREATGAIQPGGLSSNPDWTSLHPQVPDAAAMLFLRDIPDSDASVPIQAGLASIALREDALDLDGRLRAEKPLWDATRAPKVTPLQSSAEGPVFALSAAIPPDELARLVRGSDVSEADLALMSKVFEGDLGLTVYFDPLGTARSMKSGGGPSPMSFAGTLLGHAGIKDRAAAEQMVERALGRSGISFKKKRASDGTTFIADARGRALDVEITDRRLSVTAGPPLKGRKGVALAQQLRESFDPAAFGPGHLSFQVDVGQIGRDLNLATVAEGGAPAMFAFISGFIQQATAVDLLMFDLGPEPDGARVRARITLRPP